MGQGMAALAVVAPVWNIIYSLGLLMGIGGSVLFSAMRGGNERSDGRENQYFTAAVIGAAVLAVPAWGGLLVFQGPVLTFFGAGASMLALAERYMEPIRYVFPLFLFNQMPSAFLRNDKNPGLATLGVLSGGCSTCSEITSSYSPATWGSTVRGLPRPSAPAFPFW